MKNLFLKSFFGIAKKETSEYKLGFNYIFPTFDFPLVIIEIVYKSSKTIVIMNCMI